MSLHSNRLFSQITIVAIIVEYNVHVSVGVFRMF